MQRRRENKKRRKKHRKNTQLFSLDSTRKVKKKKDAKAPDNKATNTQDSDGGVKMDIHTMAWRITRNDFTIKLGTSVFLFLFVFVCLCTLH